MQWKPWDDFKADPERLPIEEPPCRSCKHFRPHRTFTQTGRFNGVVICANIGEQCNDFSCYRPREEPKQV